MTILIIVESPTKAKKIGGYLGPGYKVMASVGHIRDLPKNEMGVAPPNFKPEYVQSDRAKPIIQKLKMAAKQADMVYLATDPDREGEAIAWHLLDVIKPSKFKRVKFNAITKTAITAAIANAGEIDMALVAAQEARRTLDRLVGYTVSPLLKDLTGGVTALSAGRVQTPAVLLVVLIEKAIAEFKPTNHYKLLARFPWPGKEATWTATWQHKALQKALGHEETKLFTDMNFVNQIAGALQQQNTFMVYKAEGKETFRKPPSPFSTSLLQQVGNTKLGFSVDTTMATAQKLFDNGLITYHRTDSVDFDDGAAEEIRQFLRDNGLAVPSTRNTWSAKANAQEAHEAIRPTDLAVRKLEEFSPDSNEAKLYQLIWARTVASQMEPAKYFSVTAILVSALKVQGQNLQFIARGRTLLSEGWMKLTPDQAGLDSDGNELDADDSGESDDAALPMLTDGDRLTCIKGEPTSSVTEPPKRLTEATLVKELERNGIGRPSTYASIISNILQKGYIEMKGKKIYATKIGTTVINLLSERFSFARLDFTRIMEGGLDKIAAGNTSYLTVVRYQYDILSNEVAAVRSDPHLGAVSETLKGAFGDLVPCPKCEKGSLVRRKGGAGHYWSCSNYKECSASCVEVKAKDGTPEPDLTTIRVKDANSVVEMSEENCPKCNKRKLAKRNGQNGPFWGCTGFNSKPACKAKFSDNGGKPLLTR